MKRKTLLGIFALGTLLLSPQFHAADLTNITTSSKESWQVISNRWGEVSIEKIREAAEKADVSAQYYLAVADSEGIGVEKNATEAFKWMQSAAEQGKPQAQKNLAWMFQIGLGTETNLDKAVKWYRKAAEQGDAQAQMNLGWMYETGTAVPQDYAEAANFYRQAAEQGHSMAQNNLGSLYQKGWGVPQDAAEALKWYQKSADQGEPLGEKNLAWMYALGAYGKGNVSGQGADWQVRSGGNAPNHVLAEKWMRRAVDLNSAEGQYQLGYMFSDEVNDEGHQDTNGFPAAGQWLTKSAEQGYAKAQYQLASMLNTGELGDNQRSNCIPWFLKAAAQGYAEAMSEVGELPQIYPNNELLKSINTIELLRQSGERGSLDAQYQLAKRYQAGIGVSKDPVEAFKWMQKASQNDTTSSVIGDAIYNLALMYENGEGVTKDVSEARTLYLEVAGPVFRQSGATFRVGQMYENGEGVSRDDQKAAEFYLSEFCTTNSPDRYPNGIIEYMTPGDGAIEALFNLWSQERGFPADDMKRKQGYRTPSDLIQFERNFVNTPKAEFYLGQIYYQGKLVPQDLVEAAARLQVATNQKLQEASQSLNEVEAKMSQAQQETAKARADVLNKDFELAKNLLALSEKEKHFMPW